MKTNLLKSNREYNRILENMRGVDFSGRIGRPTERYSYLENMYRDYSRGGGGLIESVPGFRRVYSGKTIYGLHLQTTTNGKRYVIINDDGKLFRYPEDDPTAIARLGESSLVAKTESFTFPFGGKLFIGDGYNLFGINDDGVCRIVSDYSNNLPYVPTVYLNGEEHEQKNLLTSRCREDHVITSPAALARGTGSLTYRVTDESNRLCAVSGITDSTDDIFIPSVVELGGIKYTVTSIDSGAFMSNKTVRSVTLPDSIISVGVGAFYSCTALTKFIGGIGLSEIQDRAFASSSLADIYLPAAMKHIGTEAFPAFTTVSYELGSSAYNAIDGVPDNPVKLGVRNDSISLGIRIRSKAIDLLGITLDGETITDYTAVTDSDGFISEIVIDSADRASWTGKRLSVMLSASTGAAMPSQYGEDFTVKCARRRESFTNAIKYCRRAATIDGRIFLWGNPAYPSTVFYSEKHSGESSLYFGSLDYVDEGGGATVISVLPLHDGLAVFTKGSEGGESIFFHHAEESDDAYKRTIYRVSDINRNAMPLGATALHAGEPVYVSADGLAAIVRGDYEDTHAVESRSSMIAPMLSGKDLSEASLAEWCGYLVLSVGGELYLSDPRTRVKTDVGYEHEWFYLSGVGTYRNDSRVYRYASVKRDGYSLSDTPDGIADGEIRSEGIEEGETVYFLRLGDKKLEVYPTEEFSGGDFYPARRLLGYGDRLLFSTDCGDVCAFNTDMRGVAPESVASDPDFDDERYSSAMGRRIHPYFYDFDRHAPRYALVSAPDDCDIPHLRKSTVKRSLTVKLATFVGGRIFCDVGRDDGGFRRVGSVDGGVTDLSSVSFISMPFDGQESVTVALPEGERGWVEKSIALYSEEFRSPIGVYSICYRYRISGRIKN